MFKIYRVIEIKMKGRRVRIVFNKQKKKLKGRTFIFILEIYFFLNGKQFAWTIKIPYECVVHNKNRKLM